MPRQIQKTNIPATTSTGSPSEIPGADHSADELKAETEALLDEIDELLEADEIGTEKEAAEFVGNFIQKGGE